jgi:hypothetical protein
MLLITDNTFSFEVERKEAIDLERKLNVTDYGNKWSSIGDHLYNYGINKKGTLDKLIVDSTQYRFLVRLREKNGWESCRGLN